MAIAVPASSRRRLRVAGPGYDPRLYGSPSSSSSSYSSSSSSSSSLPARPRRLFSFAWQAPIMLLGSSVVFTFVSFITHVYDAARTAAVWGPEMITAVCVTISLCYGLGAYLVCWATLGWTVQEQIQTYVTTRKNGVWALAAEN
ncbi:hypothetical protein B0T24DRAFT_678867 [Lasiosphaeria ovina]|uniref:Uncharacterized protein n=1 Tax=Lasiosphaeria ovina TaxID=92902 RepID=A0AAE0KB85_9PEZI|nr:hypothetical protein B0T24DRAFT_678867 [Lasiosphaeria ovina]